MARQVSSHGFFYPPTLEGISSRLFSTTLRTPLTPGRKPALPYLNGPVPFVPPYGNEIHSYDSVPGQVFPGSICAINRSHVMGSINEDGERVETQCEGLSACGIEIGHQDKQQ